MRSRVAAIVTVIGTLCALGARADVNPDVERGFKPGLAYRIDGVDSVNLFNGNISLTIPIGQTYAVGSHLSYSFQAHYATNTWDTGYNESDYGPPPDEHDIATNSYKFPSRHTNAGLGWVVTLGMLYSPPYPAPDSLKFFYVSPDGGEHQFYSTLHENDPAESATDGASYTRDGTYLRLTSTANAYKLEFPSGEIHWFDSGGRLTKMEDRFGNHVDVEYLNEPSPYQSGTTRPVWKITDSIGRTHKVYFRKGWSYYEWVWEQYQVPQPLIPHDVVDKIELASFDGGTAVYTFNYDASYKDIASGDPLDPALTTSRPCAPRHDAHTAEYVYIPILTSISMPENVKYEVVTDRGDHVTCKSVYAGSITGNVTRMKLPTGGIVDWTYQVYGFPVMSVPVSGKIYLSASLNAGIATRTETFDGITVGRTEYWLDRINPDATWSDLSRTVKNYDGDGLLLNATVNYFSACRNPLQCSDGRDPGEYGRPMTRQKPARGSGYLSTEFQVPNDDALVTKRSTYIGHESDYAKGFENLRIAYERTEHADDGLYSDVTYSDFDGLGHYRKSVTGGNFSGVNERQAFTNFNNAVGTYKVDSNGVLLPGFTMVPTTSPWIISTYDRQWTAETTARAENLTEVQRADTVSCFDRDGFLSWQRTYATISNAIGSAPAASAGDTLAVFKGSGGNVVEERHYGGTAAPPNLTCSSAPLTSFPAGENYAMAHDYDYGVVARSWYVDASQNAFNFFVTNRTIDRNTGLPTSQRAFGTRTASGGAANDGTSTSYEFDDLGRITQVKTDQLTVTHTYSLAPAKITSQEANTTTNQVLRTTSVTFDGKGRPVKESRSMPSAATATRMTTYNALGWVVGLQDWGATAATITQYDGFGRPVSIRTPDMKADADALKIAYTGVSVVTRTKRVWTGSPTDALSPFAAAATTETYDRHGRLISVAEPATADSAATTTKYYYDVGNRLAQVCTNASANTCGQKRRFDYDGRGLLTGEEHPENGTVSYPQYDARGHLRKRSISGLPDVSYTYDRAERLTQVTEDSNPSRVLKRFDYYTSNATWPFAAGQLSRSIRYNWLEDIGYTVQVAQTYEYGASNAPGNATARVTTDHACTADCNPPVAGQKLHEFRQSFTYDVLGNVKDIEYPCFLNCAAPRTVSNTYDSGLLTGVSSGTMGNAIAYHASGLVSRVTHANGVIDDIAVDTAVPSRPQSITTTGTIAKATCVPPTFTSQPASRAIAAGTSTTLSASASGQAGQTISFTWYKGQSPDETQPVSTQASFTVSPAVTTNYWVKATNACGSVRGETVAVTVCAPVSVTGITSVYTTISRGRTVRLVASVANEASAGATYQWATVTNNAVTPLAGATSTSLYVTPSVTTTYRFTAVNACGSDHKDRTITVVPAPTVPGAVSAIYDPAANGIRIQWTASSSQLGISGYVIERRPAENAGAYSAGATATSYVDITAQIGKAYSYTVRARDVQTIYSAASLADFALASTFADEPIAVPTTTIRRQHVTELRQAVDAVRKLAGLPAVWEGASEVASPVASPTYVELIDALNVARTTLAFPSVSPTAPQEHEIIAAEVVSMLRKGAQCGHTN